MHCDGQSAAGLLQSMLSIEQMLPSMHWLLSLSHACWHVLPPPLLLEAPVAVEDALVELDVALVELADDVGLPPVPVAPGDSVTSLPHATMAAEAKRVT